MFEYEFLISNKMHIIQLFFLGVYSTYKSYIDFRYVFNLSENEMLRGWHLTYDINWPDDIVTERMQE